MVGRGDRVSVKEAEDSDTRHSLHITYAVAQFKEKLFWSQNIIISIQFIVSSAFQLWGLPY